jgi:Skp family chaperone for outer membrane proteins
MKSRTIFVSCLASMIVVVTGYEYSQAQQRVNTPLAKIGVVSIAKILNNSKRSATHKMEISSEQNKNSAELDKLSTDLKATEAMLAALKQDSSDYLTQRKKYINMRVSLETKQAINKEQSILKQYRWRKKFYQDILRITSEVAGQKGLDVVLEKDEINVPVLGVNELNQTMLTHKVLYSGGCVDITDEVIARLDKER